MLIPKIESLAIGSELLSGVISDTNTTWLGEWLLDQGYTLSQATVLPDDTPLILETLKSKENLKGALIVYGGLGPTSDDKTAEAVAQWLNCKTISHPETYQRIEERCQRLGRKMNSAMKKQALYPEATKPLLNDWGMAVSFWVKKNERLYVFCPGVPWEFRGVIQKYLFPLLSEVSPNKPTQKSVWKCFGITESELQVQLDAIESQMPKELSVSYRTNPPENHVSVRLTPSESQWARLIDDKLKPWVFSKDLSIEECIIGFLKEKKLKLAVCESCTGGQISHRLTLVEGSSEVFWGGLTVYQIDAKSKVLDVKPKDEQEAGTVKTSQALASVLKEKSQADYTLATVGFLGPLPKEDKTHFPYGEVFVSIVTPKGETVNFPYKAPIQDRAIGQRMASSFALHALWQILRKM